MADDRGRPRLARHAAGAQGAPRGPRTSSTHLEPIVSELTEENPAEEAELADSVGLAMLVVLETLSPAERVAFVLHDMFGVPFSEIADITGRRPDAARQLASRARRRVRGSVPPPDPDLDEQRRVVDAFLAAARAGDFEALLEVLDPDVVLADPHRRGRPALGAHRWSGPSRWPGEQWRAAPPFAPYGRPAIVNGNMGVVVDIDGHSGRDGGRDHHATARSRRWTSTWSR